MTDPNFRKIRRVELVSTQAEWPALFQQEAARLREAFGAQVIDIHHVGSTAIPGIKAKPIIDLLVEVFEIEKIDACNRAMEKLGYEPAGEFGIPGRRFFSRTEGACRIRNVHVFQPGHPEVVRMLAFRDYMNSHPEQAQEYSRLKEELARRFPEDIEQYTEGKTPFIQGILARAQADQGEPQAGPTDTRRSAQEESCGEDQDSSGLQR